jgi:hypothetical protein
MSRATVISTVTHGNLNRTPTVISTVTHGKLNRRATVISTVATVTSTVTHGSDYRSLSCSLSFSLSLEPFKEFLQLVRHVDEQSSKRLTPRTSGRCVASHSSRSKNSRGSSV